MAVYERTYVPYAGPRTPEQSRFLILPRYSYREVFRSKLFIAFFALCYIWPLVLAILIYLPHNLKFLETTQVPVGELLAFFKYDAGFFYWRFMIPYLFVSFVMAFIVGPALVASDLRNNGLPLYLSRPFSRTEYVLGKTTVMIVLLSLITWIPGLLLFGLQAYLGGWDWLRDNYRIAPAIVVGFGLWIAILCLVSLALSAYVKWKPAAGAALFGVFIVPIGMAPVINEMLDTSWGWIISMFNMVQVIWAMLFGVESWIGVPTWAAWIAVASACAGFLWLLSRKVRAYEVVS